MVMPVVGRRTPRVTHCTTTACSTATCSTACHEKADPSCRCRVPVVATRAAAGGAAGCPRGPVWCVRTPSSLHQIRIKLIPSSRLRQKVSLKIIYSWRHGNRTIDRRGYCRRFQDGKGVVGCLIP